MMVYILGALGAVLVLLFAGLAPRAWVAVAVHLIIFSPLVAKQAPAFEVADEAVVAVTALLAIQRCIARREVRKFPGIIFFALFLFLGAVSAAIKEVPPNVAFIGGFLAVKSIVLGASIAQLDLRVDIRYLRRIFLSVSILTVAGVILNLAIPGYWFAEFSIGGGSLRGGIASPVGLMVHPGYLAQICVLLALVIFVYSSWMSRWRLSGVLGILAFVAVAGLTLRRKALVAFSVALLLLSLRSGRHRVPILFGVSSFILVLGIVAGPALLEAYRYTVSDYLGSDSTQPRTLLYQGAVFVANENAPFGSGFGRYGTSTAFDNYSPEYVALGFQSRYGLAPGDAYALDSFWPGIVGESGWLGALAYLGGLLMMLRYAWVRSAGPRQRYVSSLVFGVGVAWWIEYMIESFAAPVFLAAPLGPLIFVVFGLALSTEPTSATSPSLTPSRESADAC